MNTVKNLKLVSRKSSLYAASALPAPVSSIWSDRRAFCGALELPDLVERALKSVMDTDANCRAREKEGAAAPAKGQQRWSVEWVSPADKTGGAP